MANLKKYKKFILWAVAIAAIIVLLAIVFRSCDSGISHKKEKNEVNQSAIDAEKKYQAEKLVSDSLRAAFQKSEDERKLLKFKMDVTEGQLQDSRTRSFRLAQDLKAAKENRDTALVLQKCDSLSDEVLNLSGVIISYEEYVDTLQKIHADQIRIKDSLIAGKDRLYSDLRISFDKNISLYNNLYVDYGKELKKRKKARTINRVLGAAVIVAGALYITK